jgi:hypothetical protein
MWQRTVIRAGEFGSKVASAILATPPKYAIIYSIDKNSELTNPRISAMRFHFVSLRPK